VVQTKPKIASCYIPTAISKFIAKVYSWRSRVPHGGVREA